MSIAEGLFTAAASVSLWAYPRRESCDTLLRFRRPLFGTPSQEAGKPQPVGHFFGRNVKVSAACRCRSARESRRPLSFARLCPGRKGRFWNLVFYSSREKDHIEENHFRYFFISVS